MSKNEKVEIKSWEKDQTKDKQTRVNKKRKNKNKRPAEESGRVADNISNAFPNFCVLSEEERVAFFEALTTARKNIEKKGIPTIRCFGTVHDEYLKYFDQNVEDEEEKQEENRFIRSNLTIRDNSDQTDGKIHQDHAEEKKYSVPIFSLKCSTPVISEPQSWKIPESIIQNETDKSLVLFFKKKKRNEEKTERLLFSETILENQVTQRNSKENYWASNMFPNRSNTPKFDALSPDEKKIFFKILQEAHDNVIEKNQNKEYRIAPLDTILRRYRGNNEVTSVFATSQDSLPRENTTRELKVTVTLESRDNERLLKKQSRIPPEAETSKKYSSQKLHPLEVNTNESEKADENSCRSEELKRTQSEMQEDSLIECKKSETEALLKNPCTSSETSPTKKKIKFSATLSEIHEENQLRKGENPVVLEGQETAPAVTDPRMNSDKNVPAQDIETGYNDIEKNCGETGLVDTLPHVSAEEETLEENVKEQPTSIEDESKEVCKSMEAEEKVKPTLEDCEVRPVTVGEVIAQERLEIKKAESEPSIPEKQENVLLKKVSFFIENLKEKSSEVVEKENKNERNEKPEKEEARRVKGKVVEERISTEVTPRVNPTEDNMDKVMIVNGDVVGKIKSLIYYLEDKANKNTYLEKEYLKLLVDYADYLSKVLESLILKREIEQKKQRNNYEIPGFSRYHDDSKETKEPEFLTCSVNTTDLNTTDINTADVNTTDKVVKENHQSMPSTEVSSKEHIIDFDPNLPVLSDSDSAESEGETRFRHRIDERGKIPTTKIRLLQDLLRQRAEFVEGGFGNLKIIQIPEPEFVPEEKPPSRKPLTEDDENIPQDKKRKFFKAFIVCCTCWKKTKKTKKTVKERMVENLKGEAVRVDVSGSKKKDAVSEILNDSTSEVLKAVERKKIMDKYFVDY